MSEKPNTPDSDTESDDVFFKVVRMRTNGKVYVYPEAYTDLSSANEQMMRSATGKYYGRCVAYVFKVTSTGAKKVRALGIDGNSQMDSTAYTGENADILNKRKYTSLMTKYFLILTGKTEDSKQKAQDFVKDVILPFLASSGLDKSKLVN